MGVAPAGLEIHFRVGIVKIGYAIVVCIEINGVGFQDSLFIVRQSVIIKVTVRAVTVIIATLIVFGIPTPVEFLPVGPAVAVGVNAAGVGGVGVGFGQRQAAFDGHIAAIMFEGSEVELLEIIGNPVVVAVFIGLRSKRIPASLDLEQIDDAIAIVVSPETCRAWIALQVKTIEAFTGTDCGTERQPYSPAPFSSGIQN